MNIETPRTDKAEYRMYYDGAHGEGVDGGENVVDSDFARELERENARLRDALERRHREQAYPMPDYVRAVLANLKDEPRSI